MQIAAARVEKLVAQHTGILCCDKLILADISIRVKTPCTIQLHWRTSCVWGPATSSALTAFLGNANMSCWSAHEPFSKYKCQGAGYTHVATGPTTVFLGTRNTAVTYAQAHSESTTGQQKCTHRRD